MADKLSWLSLFEKTYPYYSTFQSINLSIGRLSITGFNLNMMNRQSCSELSSSSFNFKLFKSSLMLSRSVKKAFQTVDRLNRTHRQCMKSFICLEQRLFSLFTHYKIFILNQNEPNIKLYSTDWLRNVELLF